MIDSQETFIKWALTQQALSVKTEEFEKLKSILNHMAIVLYIDHKGMILDVNDKFCEMTKFHRERLVGEKYHQLISTSHPTDFFIQLWQTIASGQVWKGELSHRTKDYSVCCLETTIVPFLDANQIPYQYVVIQEVPKLTKDEDHPIMNEQKIDPLTGLLSREHFANVLKNALSKRQKLALFAFNIEKFTKINDIFGLDMGDTVLKEVAKRLQTMSNHVARIIGDEFVLLCEQYESDTELNEFANYIMKLLKQPFYIEGFQLNINVDIGISQYPDDGKTAETLMNNCRVALRYEREPFGDSISYYSRTVDAKQLKSLQLVNDIYHALHKQQLLVYYQPRVDIQTGKIQGVEALIRWEHPEWGQVDPGEFLPYAEEVGLIIPISEWVLEQACLQIKLWQKKGYRPIPISVNISPKHLVKRNFIDVVKQVIKQTKMEPKWLEIELTEDVPIKGSTHVYKAVEQLKELGISVALDDFGNGYLTLNDVKMLNFDTLKIDRSFAKNLSQDSSNEAILASLIELGKGLNKKVVVEGVETNEDLHRLKELGHVDVQGYVYSRPLPADEFENLLITGMCHSNGLQKIKKEINENRRKFFRIDLPYPLKSNISINSFGGGAKQIPKTEVLVNDIGPGGLKFLSTMKFPVRSDMVLSFELNLTDGSKKILGKVVRAIEQSNGITAYGVEFILNESERDKLISLLNRLSSKIKTGKLGDLDVVKDNTVRFLLEQGRSF